MNVSDELLDKYFKNECTTEEKRLVVAFLNEIDEFPEHLITKNDWDDVTETPISRAKSDQLFKFVKRNTFAKPTKINWFKIAAAAAAIILILFGVAFYKFQSDKAMVSVSKIEVNKSNEIIWKSFVNYTDQIQTLNLPDSSFVKVYPGGELNYALPFIKAKREIYLKGKGFFEVAKDKKHPFIVYANGISTTALGTSFTITANAKSKFIKVRLHTGKVWVKNADLTHHILAFSRILAPGNELVYNNIKNDIKVISPKTLITKKGSVLELNFKQAALATVFSKLAAHYEVKITYNPADLQEMSFTGNLNLSLPLEDIINDLTELNKLNQLKTTQGYEIKK